MKQLIIPERIARNFLRSTERRGFIVKESSGAVGDTIEGRGVTLLQPAFYTDYVQPPEGGDFETRYFGLGEYSPWCPVGW